MPWAEKREAQQNLQGGAPPVIDWFINPMNTIDISAIDHSFWSSWHQLNAIELKHHLVGA